MRWRIWVAAIGLAMACDSERAAENDNDDLYMDDDVPSGNCMGDTGPCDTDAMGDESDGSGTSSTPTGGTCESTMQCGVGDTCMATFDGDIGEFECQSSCIEDHDETRWCIDDLSCCNGGSVCSARGYCLPSGAEGVGESSGGSDSGADTGTDDASTSDGGTTGMGG